jgi:peptide/nickel transport system permease protein
MTEQGQSLPTALGVAAPVSPAATIAVPHQPRRAGTLWGDAVSRLRRDRAAMAGLIVVLLVTLLAILAPVVAPYDPIKINSSATLQPPSLEHWLGTDHLGRDILSRILYGGQVSLRIGLISVGISLTFGLTLGLLAGYYGRWVDMLIMRLMDVLLAFPNILLALAIIAILGPGLTNVMIAVGISYIPHYTRVVRSSVLGIKSATYVESARVAGCSDARLIVRHILPNAVSSVIVVSTLGVATSILVAAALSFLGLGVQPPTPEWGSMVSAGRDYLRNNWWVSTLPGVTIMITVLAINVFGDGLREALDPKLKRR